MRKCRQKLILAIIGLVQLSLCMLALRDIARNFGCADDLAVLIPNR
jgi:hypothetical protein